MENDRHAADQKELIELRREVEQFKRAEARRTRVREFVVWIMRRGVFGPDLSDAAEKWWGRALEEKALPVAETGQLSAAIIRRFVRIGIIAGFFMLVQFVFMLIQVLLLAEQNTKIGKQNELIGAQNRLSEAQYYLATRQTAASEAMLTNGLALRIQAIDEAIATFENAWFALVDFQTTTDSTVQNAIAEFAEWPFTSHYAFGVPFVGLAPNPCRRAQSFATERGAVNAFSKEFDASPKAVDTCERTDNVSTMLAIRAYHSNRYYPIPEPKFTILHHSKIEPELEHLVGQGFLVELALRHRLGRGFAETELPPVPFDERAVLAKHAASFRSAAVTCLIEFPRMRKAMDAKRPIDLAAARAYNVVAGMFPHSESEGEGASRAAMLLGDNRKTLVTTIRELDQSRQTAEAEVYAILETCRALRERTWREFSRASEWVSPSFVGEALQNKLGPALAFWAR